MLVALRVFATMAGWAATGSGAVHLAVKSDSKAALGAAIAVSSPSESLNAVGREIAFDAAVGDYQVMVFEHVPGVANKVPDWLSRIRRPASHGTNGPRPASLEGAEAVEIPRRDADWWRTRVAPRESAGHMS